MENNQNQAPTLIRIGGEVPCQIEEALIKGLVDAVFATLSGDRNFSQRLSLVMMVAPITLGQFPKELRLK